MKVDEQFPVPGPARGHDVFVSYSRADRERVVELTRALAARGKRAWVDLEDIPPSAEWMAEIRSAIESADDYLVVIRLPSPDRKSARKNSSTPSKPANGSSRSWCAPPTPPRSPRRWLR